MNSLEINGEGMSGEPIYLTLEERSGIGSIKNILFENISSAAPYKSVLDGMAQSKIENIVIRNCGWRFKPRTIKMGKEPIFDLRHVKNLRFEKFRLETPSQTDQWGDIIRKKECEDIF